jgi:S-disulfanyl-L-cysteine oxidoreductase SoxD
VNTSPLRFLLISAAFLLSAQTSKTVWDGVYTADQAARGKTAYAAQCAMCHNDDLTGGDEAPPLTGAQFMGNWNGLSVGELFDRIRVSMPANNPGKLGRQQNADIIAYMLQFNKFPAGATELPTQSETLKEVRIAAQKP